jgi:hypothetical protein
MTMTPSAAVEAPRVPATAITVGVAIAAIDSWSDEDRLHEARLDIHSGLTVDGNGDVAALDDALALHDWWPGWLDVGSRRT